MVDELPPLVGNLLGGWVQTFQNSAVVVSHVSATFALRIYAAITPGGAHRWNRESIPRHHTDRGWQHRSIVSKRESAARSDIPLPPVHDRRHHVIPSSDARIVCRATSILPGPHVAVRDTEVDAGT